MEKFNWIWKYPHNITDVEIIFDKKGDHTVRRNKNGRWLDSNDNVYRNPDIIKNFENEYQKYKTLQREQKLKRILNGKI